MVSRDFFHGLWFSRDLSPYQATRVEGSILRLPHWSVLFRIGDHMLGVVAVALAIALVLYSDRYPIWRVRFLHFALGALPGGGDAWQVIRETVLTFNFNQTGIYMMADFWLLKLFGASAFALRLPSLLSAAWLLIAAASVLTMRGFWQSVEACRRAGDPGAGAAHELCGRGASLYATRSRGGRHARLLPGGPRCAARLDARPWCALYRVGRTGASVFPWLLGYHHLHRFHLRFSG